MQRFDSRLLAASADAETAQQNYRIFRIYQGYRLLLSLILGLTFEFRSDTSPLGSIDADLFVNGMFAYAVFNLVSFIGLPLVRRSGPKLRGSLYFATLIIDILFVTLLSYTCGGVSSGLVHLLIIPVATGSLLFGTRLGVFLASVGSIAAIYSESYLNFVNPAQENFYVQVGLLGMILFATSLTLQYLGFRIRQKEQINRQQAASIQALQKINQQVIERMQTGIVVVTPAGDIINSNDSALKLLVETAEGAAPFTALPTALREQFDAWLRDPAARLPAFQTHAGGPEVLATFTWLEPGSVGIGNEARILIFLEDYSKLSSRAQQLKLMSLGRLSASIAHEIRNPLGAISHACQLLDESPDLNAGDRRLLNIINTHADRLNTIIENILEHSRPRLQAPELFDLRAWLPQFAARFCNSFSEAVECELELGRTLPEMLRFNLGQLERLLTNVCENAQRYSKLATGRRYVGLRLTGHDAERGAVLDIVDLGPGVPEEDMDKIFEPFFTTDNQGTGLGLFMCREICEANLARIHHCRSHDGLSCFRIQFAHPERSIH